MCNENDFDSCMFCELPCPFGYRFGRYVCPDCTREELPDLLARSAVFDLGDSAFDRLSSQISDVEREYWKTAARMLSALTADEEEDEEEDEDDE